MGLQPYPEYKDSGLPWLKEVPVHWAIHRGKYVFKSIDIRSKTGKEELLTVSSQRGVVRRQTMKVTMFQAESYINHKLCWPGDLVVNSLWAWAGGLGVSKNHGIISTAYGVYRPKPGLEEYAGFIHELVRSAPFHWELQVRSKGVWTSRLKLTDDSFLTAPLPLPTLSEAQSIVRYISQLDRRINRFIRNRRQLMAVLSEQMRGIIRKYTTRGVDSDVAFRPTLITQFKEMPVHWEESQVKREVNNLDHRRVPLSSAERGTMSSRQYDYYGASGIIDKVDDYLFDDELLLIAEDGANLVLRNLPLTIIAKGKFWVNNHAHILKLKKGNIRYFAYLMELIDYRPWITGAAQPKLTGDRLMRIKIPVPPVNEQTIIVSNIEAEVAPLQVAFDKAKREIDLIREYRTRLIADVVTGKVDVRHLTSGTAEGETEDLEADEEYDDGMGDDDEPEILDEASNIND